MGKTHLVPDKCKILSGSVLKLFAVITMLIDHIGEHLVDRSIVLFSVAGHDFLLYPIMRGIGRMAFPVFCFLLIEGFIHTRNRIRYGISLLIFALISEIPWNLVHSGKFFYGAQNVFFTLLLGYLGLCAINAYKKYPLLVLGSLIALAIIGIVAKTDYNAKGIVFILLLYALRENEIIRPFTAFVLHNQWWAIGSFIPISLYNGKRGFIKGPVLKYAFYAFYPVHLLVIYLFKYKVFF